MTSFTPLPPMDGAVLRSRAHGMRRDMLAIWDALWRRKWIPVVAMLAGLAIGIGAMLTMPPLYKASVRIMIDAQDGRKGVLPSEVAIVESTPVMAKTAGSLMLFGDPQFTAPRWWERALGKGNALSGTSDRVMRRLDDMIRVRILPDTSIIDISVHDKKPERAAQIANAVLSAYQERKADERFEQSRNLSLWMGKQLEEIRGEGAAAKERLAAFMAAHPESMAVRSDIQAQRMMMLKSDMAQTQNDIIALSQRMAAAQAQDAKAAAGRREHLAALHKSESELTAELKSLETRYGDKHPKIIDQKAKIARVQADIRAILRGNIPDIDRDLSAAKAKVDSLQAQIDAISDDVNASGRDRMELQSLQDEVATNERLYNDMLVKYQDMNAQGQMRGQDIKVISMATIPSSPDQGARLAMIAGLAFIGLISGFAFVILRLLWASGFTSANQLEGLTGYPVVAAIPVAGTRGAVHHNVVQDPAAILAESLRSLRVSMRLRGETGRRPRVVAFTSTLPEEGKTSLSVMLAMIAAKSGERVCVVDCDLRRPSLHKAFGIGNARGLADYLSDRLGIDDVIYRKDPSGVHLITAKAVPSYSLTLLTSGRMERLIETLREQYDLVILDAPSSLAFADARVLARMVDQTLYVVAWNRTRRESVIASLKSYADLGYADLALVLNKVDLSEYLRDSAAAVVYQYGHELKKAGGEAYAT